MESGRATLGEGAEREWPESCWRRATVRYLLHWEGGESQGLVTASLADPIRHRVTRQLWLWGKLIGWVPAGETSDFPPA